MNRVGNVLPLHLAAIFLQFFGRIHQSRSFLWGSHGTRTDRSGHVLYVLESFLFGKILCAKEYRNR